MPRVKSATKRLAEIRKLAREVLRCPSCHMNTHVKNALTGIASLTTPATKRRKR